MALRRILLPATATTAEARLAAVHDLVVKHHRRNLITTGYVLDIYPSERFWVDQPGNTDPKRRVYYAEIFTRLRTKDDDWK
jgi:hypothetical protein